VPSFTAKVSIPNNATADVGPARLGVTWLEPGPPPQARIAVMPHNETDDVADRDYDLSLGEVFPIGAETWRFADVAFQSRDRWHVVVTRVAPDEEPWEPPALSGDRVWMPIDARPFGQLDEAQVAELETRLGRALPPVYRDWLAETNGLQPVGDHHVRGLRFALFEQRPLLGVHPEFLPYDLAEADRRQRRMWLSDDYVVIAAPSGGLLAVRVNEPGLDHVVFLPESATTGPATVTAHAARERHLVSVAPDVNELVELLQPLPPIGNPDAVRED
jgi:hypothetical protein